MRHIGAFQIASTVPSLGNPARGVGRFVCGTCESKLELPLAGKVNPEALVKKAQAQGWDTALRSSSITCPRCAEARQRRITKKTNADTMPAAVAVQPTLPIRAPVLLKSVSNEESAVKPALDLSPLREATQAERMKIRGLLDKHFDDAVGRYLDGQSDQKIGAAAGVPWALVTKIREVGYGPIRVDPEIDALQQMGRQLAAKQTALQDEIVEYIRRVDAFERKREAA